MKTVLTTLVVAGIFAYPAYSITNSPPTRITKLEQQVKALQYQIIQVQRRQVTASQANDIQQTELDYANAGVMCLASWISPKPVDDFGACDLLNLSSTTPDYNGLIRKLSGR